MPPRPPVSVVVPFYGTPAQAEEVVARFAELRLRDGDEVLLADNSPGGAFGAVALPAGLRVVDAAIRTSPYTARNVAAAVARNDWLAFVDGDVRPSPDLLDAYLADPPADDVGILAGRVADWPGQPGLVPAYVRSRRHYDQERNVAHPYGPVVITANLLVRRAAFDAVGGFCDGVRSGADSDFSWRVHQAGWRVTYVEAAGVEHPHRDRLGDVVRQVARDGAGKRWLQRRFPGSSPVPGAAAVLRSVVGVPVWLVLLQPRRALFKAMDGVLVVAEQVGTLAGNAAPDRATRPVVEVVVTPRFPEPGGLRAAPGVRVEADRRPLVLAAEAHGADAAWLEEDGPVHRARSLLWWVRHRPGVVLAVARRRGLRRAWELAPRARRVAGVPRVVAGAGSDGIEVAAIAGRRHSTKVR